MLRFMKHQDAPAENPPDVSRQRDYRVWLTIPLGLTLGMAVIFVPHLTTSGSFALAADYRNYYAAVHLFLSGRNPYNQSTLISAAQRVHAIPMALSLRADGFVLFPFVLWPLIPLALLPYGASFVLLVVLSLGAIIWSLSSLASHLRWQKFWLVPLFGCLWWPVVWGRVLGQLDFLILVGLVATCLLVSSHRYYFAGIALASVWVQPELGWVAVVAVIVLLWGDRRALMQTLGSFLAFSIVLFGISALSPHGMLTDWVTGGGVFVHREASHETDLLGLPAILQIIIPHDYKVYGASSVFTLGIAFLGTIAAIGTGAWLRRSEVSRYLPTGERVLWQMFVPVSIWILVTPYGHPENLLLLLPLALLVIGPDARRIAHRPGQVLCLGAFIVLTELFTGTVLLSDLVPIATLILLVAAARTLWTINANDGPELEDHGLLAEKGGAAPA
jgi:hypothetical protein